MTQHLAGATRPHNIAKTNILDRPLKYVPQPAWASVAVMSPACSICTGRDATVEDTGWTAPLPERLCAGCRERGDQ